MDSERSYKYKEDTQDEEKQEKLYNEEEYTKKKDNLVFTVLDVHIKEYCDFKKPLPMKKIYAAPRIKKDHSFINEKEYLIWSHL